MNSLSGFMAKIGIFGELLAFLWHRKLWWLIPLIVILVIFGVLLVLGAGSAVAPFIYPFF